MDERETKRAMGKEGRVNNSEFRGPYAGDECMVGNNFRVEKGRVCGKKISHTRQCGEGNEDDNLDLAFED